MITLKLLTTYQAHISIDLCVMAVTDRQTDRQTERQTGGQTERQTERQADSRLDHIITKAPHNSVAQS